MLQKTQMSVGLLKYHPEQCMKTKIHHFTFNLRKTIRVIK